MYRTLHDQGQAFKRLLPERVNLTGLDDYVENLPGSSFDVSSSTKRKPNAK